MFETVKTWWGPAPTPVEKKPFDPTDPKQNPLNPEGLKPCCACPQTKSARDECFFKSDSSVADEKCKELVQSHIACMRGYGFKL